jgi:hypothetical protein
MFHTLLDSLRADGRRRGQTKVALEWTLVCVSYNLKRLFTLKNLAAAA